MASQTLEEALLGWINTFPLVSRVKSFAELSDGLVFSRMLEDLDPAYAVQEIENSTIPSPWLRKKKALEAVYRSLLRYIQNHTSYDPGELQEPINFDAIAEHDDVQHTTQLITLFLMAGVTQPVGSPTFQKSIARMNLMEKWALDKLVGLAEKKVVAQVTSASTQEDGTLPLKLNKALDLAFEAEHANLQADYTSLKKRHADIMTRFESLQDRHDENLQRSKETKDELQRLKISNGSNQDDIIRSLKTRLLEAEELIDSQERQIENDRKIKEINEKSLASLAADRKRLTDLDDEVRELRDQNASLSRKANKVDHFQKKIESLRATEKENIDLRRQKEVLEENQKAYDQLYLENQKHKAAGLEYSNTFVSQEGTIVELNRQKRVLTTELRNREARIQELEDRAQHDAEFVRDAEERMRIGAETDDRSPNSPSETKYLTLEQELEESGDPAANYDLEISRLQYENNLLKSNTGGTTNAHLRVDLEDAEKNMKRQQESLRDLTEKYAIGQEQLSAIISNSAGEKLVQVIDRLMTIGPIQILTDAYYRDEAISHTRRLYMETNDELTNVKGKLAQLETDLTSRDRELLEFKATLIALDRDEELEALADLKAAHELVTSSLENDLVLFKGRYQAVAAELEEKKSHLMDTLVSNNRLLNDLASLKERPGTNNDDETERARAQSYLEEQKKNKTALEALKERTKKQEVTIQDLHRALKSAEEASPDAQKAANESMIKNLTRENALIATAWYDLTSRLQSNHVVLQRRQDAPKSWLNKQRQMVNATPRR